MSSKIISGLLVTSILGAGLFGVGAVSAWGGQAKAEELSELTGKTVEEIVEERRDSGKTYGELADEYRVLDQFSTNENCDGTGMQKHDGTGEGHGNHRQESKHNQAHELNHSGHKHRMNHN